MGNFIGVIVVIKIYDTVWGNWRKISFMELSVNILMLDRENNVNNI
jgi:hypothetical protein